LTGGSLSITRKTARENAIATGALAGGLLLA
jgi:hypothetical protein